MKRRSFNGQYQTTRFLSPEIHETIWRSIFEGRSVRAIARELNIPKTVVGRWAQETPAPSFSHFLPLRTSIRRARCQP